MAYAPYEFLFTDQNVNREFVVQPYTTNGPSSPTGGIDPSAASANTTLFLYGKGSPNYGDRIQEDMIYMLEHFFSTVEPSFPIPGQLWCQSSSNELTQPFQMYMFNPRKFKITASSGNNIYVQSDDGSLSTTQVQARFTSLGTARQFTVYSSTYQLQTFVQSALPSISGSNVLLTVSPATTTSLVGQYIGGWEEIYQGNAQVVLRRAFNANGFNIINLATPVNTNDAATKGYVDSAVTGGTIKLGNLADVQYQTPGHPQTGAFLFFNGTDWTDELIGNLYLSLTGGTMSGAINMGGFGITNVANPTGTYDAVNKNYVDTQPLSAVNVSVTSPAVGNLLYFTTGGIWQNATPATAGVVPLTGNVTITGSLSLNGNSLTGIANPVNSTDAVNLQYLDSVISAGGGVVTGGNVNAAGVLTLNISGFPNVTIPGFLPTSNNDSYIVFTPQNPNSKPTSTAATFFAGTLGDATISGPLDIQDPINVSLHAALNQIDLALGQFTLPRQRFVFPVGSRTQFEIYNGTVTLSALKAMNGQFVKGSNNLALYVNGVKQIESTSAFTTINSTNFSVGASYSGVTITSSGIVITGDVSRIFHPGVQFNISGSAASQNNGDWITISSSVSGGNTTVTARPNEYSATPGNTLTAGTGNITYTVNDLTNDMETGYVFPGTNQNYTLTVTLGLGSPSAVTVTLNPSTANISTMALLCDAINSQAASHYINSIVNISDSSHIDLSGDVRSSFPTGTVFVVRYSTGNNGTYTTTGAPAIVGGNTRIQLTTTLADETVNGLVFQDQWGFTCHIENGNLVFRSNVAGSLCTSLSVTDPGKTSNGLLTNITGITWPITFTAIGFTATMSNPFTPTDYAYYEVGLHGYLSSMFVFNSDVLVSGDTLEVSIDRELLYNSFNPIATATIA